MATRPGDPAAFRPYIPTEARMAELTPLPLIVGTLLGMVFGASSLYLVLKVGHDGERLDPGGRPLDHALPRFSRGFGVRNATILENNIVQTAGSAGESIAFGVGVTMPAIMILGFDLEITRVMLVAVLGGLLGILMMIPLRRALIVQQHGILKYPEGTACAEVLKAGASEESRAVAAKGGLIGRSGGLPDRRQDDLHRLRHRLRLPGRDVGAARLEGHSRKGLRRAPSSPDRSARRSPPPCSAWVTSSARASRRSCARAACSPTSC